MAVPMANRGRAAGPTKVLLLAPCPGMARRRIIAGNNETARSARGSVAAKWRM
jgi:hypothetical protein